MLFKIFFKDLEFYWSSFLTPSLFIKHLITLGFGSSLLHLKNTIGSCG